MKTQNKLGITLLFILSAAVTGCVNLSSWVYEEFPKRIALDKSYSYDGKVIIVGAGASGLAVLHEYWKITL